MKKFSFMYSPIFYSILLNTFLILLPSRCFCQTDTNFTINYWEKGRIYKYKAIVKDSLGNIVTTENIEITPTGQVWEIDRKQTLATFHMHFNLADSLKLAPFPLNGVKKAWRKNYQEGVISNDSQLWMHPIRFNQYCLTEIAPFPEVKFPLYENKKWKNTMWIYKAFGSFMGTVESVYSTQKPEIKKFDFGEIKCWKIEATGVHNKLGVNSITIYFHEKIGFVELQYQFFNGMSMQFILTEYQMP